MRRRIRREDSGLTYCGPIVDVELAIPETLREILQSQGTPIPEPIRLSAIIDTGASWCGVMEGIPASLGLEPIGTKPVRRGGNLRPASRAQYAMRLSILDELERPIFSEDVIFVENQVGGDEYKVLMGRDILDGATFVYHGGRKIFRLQF